MLFREDQKPELRKILARAFMAAESEQEFAFEKNGSLFNWVAFDQNGMDDDVLK